MDAEAVVEVAPLVRTEVDLDSVGQARDEPVLEPGPGTKIKQIRSTRKPVQSKNS